MYYLAKSIQMISRSKRHLTQRSMECGKDFVKGFYSEQKPIFEITFQAIVNNYKPLY